MDNKTFEQLKTCIFSNDCAYQLVPPHNHWANPAKQAIQTFKNHFITTLCTTDPSYPQYLWNHVVKQAEITLLLLYQSNLHFHLSAYTHIYKAFHFNVTLMALAKTKVVILNSHNIDKPSTWSLMMLPYHHTKNKW